MPVQATTLPLPTARYSEDIVTAIRGKAGESKSSRQQPVLASDVISRKLSTRVSPKVFSAGR